MDYTYLVRLSIGKGQGRREKRYKLNAPNIAGAAEQVSKIGKGLGEDFAVKEIKRACTRK